MVAEIILIVLLIIILIIAIIFNISVFEKDRYTRISTTFVILVASILLGMSINTIITPTIEDYIHGKVRVEINQVYENGEVVRCDTNYYKL